MISPIMLLREAAPGAPIVVDNSLLSTFRTCHEKCCLQYFMRLAQKLDPTVIRESAARTFGHAWHAALKVMGDGLSMDEAEKAFVAEANGLLPELIEGAPDPRTIERGFYLLHAYAERWANEPFRILRDSSGKAYTEMQFTIHLFDYEGHPVLYTGVIDRITVNRDRIYIPDIKSTRQSLSVIEKKVRLNHQLTGYYIGAKSLGIDNIFAVGYDAVYISDRAPNPGRAAREGKPWFKLGVDIDKDFLRRWSTRTPRDVDEFMKDTIATTKELIQHIMTDSDRWCRSAPDACFAFNRPCAYIRICQSNRDETVMATYFEQRDWWPLESARKAAEMEED